MEEKQSPLKVLEEKHEEFNNDEPIIKRLVDELSFMHEFIKKFFSSYGEAEGIRKMYRELENDTNGDKKVVCGDCYKASEIYKEYIHGMISFIKDINNSNSSVETDRLAEYGKKFVIAKQNDLAFIESLFNGKLAEKQEEPLSYAVVNIEYLIDLLPGIENMKEQCLKINGICSETTDINKKELLENCLNMLFESVRMYCYYATKEVVSTYMTIQKVINGDEETEIEFKVF